MTVQQQLKGCKVLNKVCEGDTNAFVNERYTKGVFPSKMVYKMVRGLHPGVYPYKSTPSPTVEALLATTFVID